MVLLLPVPLLAASVLALESPSGLAREATYPPEIRNITHEPWRPRTGEGVRISVLLSPDAPRPDAVAVIVCRVEPEYVCSAQPLLLAPRSTDAWSGVLAYDPHLILPETIHVGYNVTLRHRTDDGLVRIAAPNGEAWRPPSFPPDAEGSYYFFTYLPTERSPAPGPHLALLVLLVGLAAQTARARGCPDG